MVDDGAQRAIGRADDLRFVDGQTSGLSGRLLTVIPPRGAAQMRG